MFCQECGGQVSESQNFCVSCGANLASSTGTSQLQPQTHKRYPPWFWWSLAAIVGITILAAIPGLEDTSQPGQDSTQNVAGNVATAPAAGPSVPQDESDFINTVTTFATRYERGANEFQKSAIRRERAGAISGILPNASITGWMGQISSMQTTSDGLGILSVKLPGNFGINVETWNNTLSDIGDHTLIPQGSPVYNQIAGLAVGDEVIFNGYFVLSDLDYAKEASLTEEGAMAEPDFIFTFSGVSKAKR